MIKGAFFAVTEVFADFFEKISKFYHAFKRSFFSVNNTTTSKSYLDLSEANSPSIQSKVSISLKRIVSSGFSANGLTSKAKNDGGVVDALTENSNSVRECDGIFKRRVQKKYTSAKIPSRHQLGEFSLGKSMIEMLGVLAIIAVLSVGGIAGYSKAMLMWRSNIQKNMLTQIITTMIKIKPNLNHSSKSFDNITYLFDAMGEVPEGTLYNNGYIYDKDGNRVDISYGLQTIKYQDGHQNQSFIYVARFRFISNGNSLTPSAETYCKNLIEATQPVANEIQNIYFIQANSKSELGESGKTLFSRSDLQKATLNDIHKKCKMVLDEGGNARFSLYLNPY